jgi:hypothetical protein
MLWDMRGPVGGGAFVWGGGWVGGALRAAVRVMRRALDWVRGFYLTWWDMSRNISYGGAD